MIYCSACTLAGLPANAITWKNLSPVSRDPRTARYRDLGHLGWPGCRVIAKPILLRLTNVPRSRQTDTSPTNRASTAQVIRFYVTAFLPSDLF